MKCPNENCGCELQERTSGSETVFSCPKCGFVFNYPEPLTKMPSDFKVIFLKPKLLRAYEEWLLLKQKSKKEEQDRKAGLIRNDNNDSINDENKTTSQQKEKAESPFIPADSDLYSLGWSSDHPGHIVYLIDLSESMRWNEFQNIKDVLEVMSVCIKCMVTDCTPGEGDPIERFTISVIGYNSKIIPLLQDKNVADLEDYLLERKRLPLFDISKQGKAYPQYQTYMASAFYAAAEDIKVWISEQQKAGKKIPAPYVIHVTDGHPEESDENDKGKNISEEKAMEKALAAASDLKGIKVEDGNVLLFNIHYDSRETNVQEIITPAIRPSGSSVYDKRKQFLYDASSVLPERIVKKINDMVKTPEERETDPFVKYVHNGSRAMISNTKNKSLLNNFVVFSSLTGTRK